MLLQWNNELSQLLLRLAREQNYTAGSLPGEFGFMRGREGDFELEPIAAVGEPPTKDADWNCCRQRPPKRERQIGQ